MSTTKMSQKSKSQATSKGHTTTKGKKGVSKKNCVSCKTEVSADQKAIQCECCDEYIHLGCDSELHEKVYDVLTKYDNPLIYLCPVCKPKVMIKNNGIEVENKISDLSKQINLVNTDIKAYTTSQVIQIKQIEDKIDEFDIKSKYSVMTNRLEEMEQKMNDMYQQMIHVGKEQEQTGTLIAELKKTQGDGTTGETEEQQKNGTGNGWETVRKQRPDKPTGNQVIGQSGKEDCTLVLYNTKRQRNDMEMAQRIADYHQIPTSEIVGVRRIDKGNLPLEIEVRSVYVKWMLIKEINRCKLEGIYARPFMTMAQLNEDRELSKQLREIRAKNADKIYKIVRGEIVMKTDLGFEKVKVNVSKN